MGKIIYNSWKDLELILRPWALTICMENPEIPVPSVSTGAQIT